MTLADSPAAGTKMTVVYALEEPPVSWSKAIFAAGPTPRSQDVASWRPQLLELLEESGYDGVVFIPEDRSGTFHGDYTGQVDWEERCLHLADVILFWVPRDMATMPALTTNTEWGTWANSGKVVFGSPPEAEKNTYLRHYAHQFAVPTSDTLAGTTAHALEMLGSGAHRTGGETPVPLYVWRTPSFQSWYRSQRSAGNTLRGAKVLWTLRAGPEGAVFLWACHVDVWVASEGRAKTNEVVVARTDISTVVMYRRGDTLDNSEVVLVREFRSPGASADGYVWECPGGSTWRPGVPVSQVAVDEAAEETGLHLDASRLRRLGSRQLAATFSAHRAHAMAVELTESEVSQLRAASAAGAAFGEPDTCEITYVEVRTVAEIRSHELVDWSTLGMILEALS